MMHQIREEYYLYSIQWGIITGMTEFVDRFGANVRPLEEELMRIDGLKRDASRLYIDQEYTDVLELIREARLQIADALNLAQEIKDQALMWIYITEWITVTGTSMFAGFVVWTLMVKRRLYKEVTTTRLIEH